MSTGRFEGDGDQAGPVPVVHEPVDQLDPGVPRVVLVASAAS